MTKVKHFTFKYEYRSRGILVSEITVAVLDLPNGKDLVLLTYKNERDNSKAMSAADRIATRLVARLGLDAEQTMWAEHYPVYHPDRIDLVRMRWDFMTGKYLNPYWEQAPIWMTEYIFEALKQPIEFKMPAPKPEMPYG
ncbi:MAG: hypothetical protein PF450_10045 [Bacteroidales bacterium]|jgi:hypothetical protein|nr:hypothetical protein [Bacteroidales bacterium]